MAVVNWSLQHFSDTAANMTANNPVLLEGQIGIETDGLTTTPKFKIGDGTTAWNALPYFYGGALAAQNLQNVLSIGSATGGLGYNITLTTGDVLYIGNNTRSIYTPALGTTGITLDNTNSSEYIILKDAGGVDFSGTTVTMAQLGYLNGVTSSIQTQLNNKQPLDVDLTSWAGVTRAAGFDTFATTPSSANLAALVTGETGSGALVFGTSPTFTTDITTPKINGVAGLEITSDISLTGGNRLISATAGNLRLNGSVLRFDISGTARFNINAADVTFTPAASTSGATTPFTITFAANTGQTASTEISNFKVNGATKTWAAGAITTQRWNYFTANTAAFASASTVTYSYGFYAEKAVAGTNATITYNIGIGTDGDLLSAGNYHWQGTSTPTTTNYTSYKDAATAIFNGGDNVALSNNGTTYLDIRRGGYTSGTRSGFTFSHGNNTGQTASTEINGYLYNSYSRQWATGALTTQREHYLKTVTYSFVGASTITNSYGLYVEAATAGTNATITNNWALGTNGGIFLNGTANTVLGSAALATTATSGFLHVPSCAGVPTGVPTLYTGMIPIVCDSTNNKMYIYSGGAWVALN